MNGEYVVSIEEFSYLLSELGAPTMGDQFLKNINPKNSWEARETILLEGKESLIARGLIRSFVRKSGIEEVSIDPDLRAIFESGFPSRRAMLIIRATEDERKMTNIYFKKDGTWIAQSSHENGYMIKAGNADETIDFVLGLVSLSKPTAPEFPERMKFDFGELSEAAQWSLSERKKVFGLEEPLLSEIADTFDPMRTGMITCTSLDSGGKDSRGILFLEGEKYSWVFRTRGYQGKGEIANGGLDRLKEEIAKLLE